MRGRKYQESSVLDAALERVSFVFDEYEDISVAVSGGKDSTVLHDIATREAVRRGRTVRLFFLDQEFEYASTVELMRKMMSHPGVDPRWYQVPLKLTNASSFESDLLCAWEEGKEWIRQKEPGSIRSVEGKYPQRFYPFIDWYEKRSDKAAFLVGLRAEESLHRYVAVTKHPGRPGVPWSTRVVGRDSCKFYPLYDWGHGDVWKYIDEMGLSYNVIYDRMFQANNSVYNNLRVSNLIHEKSFKCLTDLQVLEPQTYEAIVRRVPGAHCAAIYAKEPMIYSSRKLPEKFATWSAYRNYLLSTLPYDRRIRFESMFSKQPSDEDMARRQVRQVLMGDHENNLDIVPGSKVRQRKVKDLARWWSIL